MSAEVVVTGVDPQVVGAKVEVARKAKGLTRFTLAASAGMRENTLYRIESGQNLPTLDNIVRLAAALDTTVDELTKAEVA